MIMGRSMSPRTDGDVRGARKATTMIVSDVDGSSPGSFPCSDMS